MSGLDVTRAYDLDFRFPASDTVVGATLRTFGEFSRVELDVLLHLAPQPSGVMIDAGANIGSLALPFATRTAPRNGDQATLTGDFNIVALPEGMGLPADIPRPEGPDAPFPTSLEGLPYLRRYGF